MEQHPPSVKLTAFSCPHCGAYTTQYWFDIWARRLDEDRPIPFFPDEETKNNIKGNTGIPVDERDNLLKWIAKYETRNIIFDAQENSGYPRLFAINLHASQCYNCKKIAIWVNDRIVYPENMTTIKANKDIPDHILIDFEEASKIVDISPRGAAALLRLSIQKLCKHLGEKGKNIDEDIGSLVKKGLNPLVQKSLDIVRVIGNEAVHPGAINLQDNKEICIALFDLVNAITEQMISHPKTVQALYEKLPPEKVKAIEKRDKE